MGRIAVDVVLLPDEDMTNRAIELNAKLVEEFGRKIVLHKENCLPHISLAMGCIDVRDIGAIEKVLAAIAERCPLIKSGVGELKIIAIHTSTNSRGETVSVFEVEKTKELQSLHEMVSEKVQPYFSSVVTADMIYGDEEVAQTTLEWIKNYREKSSFARFYPHITIGYGEAQEQEFPIKFAALKLALCHLGNHCTCRKVLSSVGLGS
jgi:2'-5' RNA ligase